MTDPPRRFAAGRAFTETEPYSDVSSSRFRHRRSRLQPLDSSRGALARFPAWTCSARTAVCRTGEGNDTQRPKTPSVVSANSWCLAGSSRHQMPTSPPRTITCLISREALRTVSPCLHRPSRQARGGFLPASFTRTGLPCGSPLRTTLDASDRLLLPITLTTSTRASSVPDSCRACARPRTGGLVLHGTLPASAGRSVCARWGVLFPDVNRTTEPLTSPVAVSSFVGASHRLRARLRRGRDRFVNAARDGDDDSTIRDAFHR